MATARMTFGTVMDTVGDAAIAVSTVVGTGIKGINMLDKYVTFASLEQDKRGKARLKSLDKVIAEEIAIEAMNRQIKIDEIVAKSPRHAELFQQNYDEILKAITEG
jgi:hypothetical protein